MIHTSTSKELKINFSSLVDNLEYVCAGLIIFNWLTLHTNMSLALFLHYFVLT